jgi:hypothetical protein
MKSVHAEDHLLEGAWRHSADDDRIVFGGGMGREADACGNAAKVNNFGGMAAQSRRPRKIANVPTLAAG